MPGAAPRLRQSLQAPPAVQSKQTAVPMVLRPGTTAKIHAGVSHIHGNRTHPPPRPANDPPSSPPTQRPTDLPHPPGKKAKMPAGVGDTEPVNPPTCGLALWSVPFQRIRSVLVQLDQPPSSSHRCHTPLRSSYSGPDGSYLISQRNRTTRPKRGTVSTTWWTSSPKTGDTSHRTTWWTSSPKTGDTSQCAQGRRGNPEETGSK